jgi:hypothetical protein
MFKTFHDQLSYYLVLNGFEPLYPQASFITTIDINRFGILKVRASQSKGGSTLRGACSGIEKLGSNLLLRLRPEKTSFQ